MSPDQTRPASELTLDDLVADRGTHVVVCCGTGGVGKTTVSAALAVRAADAGRRVVLLTVDPARRLAHALGVDALGSEPTQVAGIDPGNGGRLDAMMLNAKHALDAALDRHTDAATARRLRANPVYQRVGEQFAGTQEYMAMEELGRLVRASGATSHDPRWDLIVVDTPPSRSALDFLDAPRRLDALFDSKLMLTLAPARGAARLMNAGVSLVLKGLQRAMGGSALADLQAFLAAFDGVLGGFRQRAVQTKRTLASPSSAFVVVASPRRAALREASFFLRRLAQDGLHAAGLVINGSAWSPLSLSADEARRLAESAEPATADVLWAQARLMDRAAAEARAVAEEVPRGGARLCYLAELPGEVVDVGVLRLLGRPVST